MRKELTTKQKKIIIGTAAILFVIIVIIIALIQSFSIDKKVDINIQSAPETLTGNSGNYASLQSALASYITRANEYNNRETKEKYDITIRSEETIKYPAYNLTKLVVDVPDAEQSWSVQYSWTDDMEKYTGEPIVECLPIEQLIYGDFKCFEINEAPSNLDPVLQYLPYDAGIYEVNINEKNENGKGLKVYIHTAYLRGDYTIDAIINNTKQSVSEWLKSHNLNIDNYEIEYDYDK